MSQMKLVEDGKRIKWGAPSWSAKQSHGHVSDIFKPCCLTHVLPERLGHVESQHPQIWHTFWPKHGLFQAQSPPFLLGPGALIHPFHPFACCTWRSRRWVGNMFCQQICFWDTKQIGEKKDMDLEQEMDGSISIDDFLNIFWVFLDMLGH